MKKTLLVVLLFISLDVFSQGNSDSKEIAYKLFEITNMKDLMDQSINNIIDVQIRSNPNLAVYEGVMKEFAKDILNFDSLKSEYAQLYIEEFTKDELEELVEFYKTDLGQKTIIKMPFIMQKGMLIGEREMSRNMDKLNNVILQRQKEMIVDEFGSTAFQNYVAVDSSFTISIPENWETDIQLVNGAIFQAANPQKEMYSIVMSEELPDTDNYNQNAQIQEMFSSISANMKDFVISDSSNVNENNLLQKRYSFSGMKGELGITYYFIAIEGKNKAYYIFNWTLTDLFEVNKQYFEKVANTFSEIL